MTSRRLSSREILGENRSILNSILNGEDIETHTTRKVRVKTPTKAESEATERALHTQVSVLNEAVQRSNTNLEQCHTVLRRVIQQRDDLHLQVKLLKKSGSSAHEGGAKSSGESAILSKLTRVNDALTHDLRKMQQEAELLRQSGASSRMLLEGQAHQLSSSVKGIKQELWALREDAAQLPLVLSGEMHKLHSVVEQLGRDAALKQRVADMEAEMARMRQEAANARFAMDDMDEKYQRIQSVRRQLHNQVQKLRGNIRVLCRVRPLNEKEMRRQEPMALYPEPRNQSINVLNGRAGRQNDFEYDCVLDGNTSQEEVFSEVEDLIHSVTDGYNVCIFAYGQTGSGKTHTMEGRQDNRGVNHRALTRLFQIVDEQKESFHYNLSMNMVEIYNEQIQDLLADAEGSAAPSEMLSPSKSSISIVSTGNHGVYARGVRHLEVSSQEQVNELIEAGFKMRAMTATNVHDRSSRSHCILTIHVQAQDVRSGTQYTGKLSLVDLAGSENVNRSQVEGQHLREAQNINRSLSALGDVFMSLANKSKHVPYRNSKLTHLLSDSLGGDSKTLMICCLSPGELSIGETLNSLVFAKRVSSIRLGPAQRHTSTSLNNIKSPSAASRRSTIKSPAANSLVKSKSVQ